MRSSFNSPQGIDTLELERAIVVLRALAEKAVTARRRRERRGAQLCGVSGSLAGSLRSKQSCIGTAGRSLPPSLPHSLPGLLGMSQESEGGRVS